MRIRSVRPYLKNLALAKPYTIAYETVSDVENVFLEIELDNGMVGIGAANPSPEVVGESPDQVLEKLQGDWIQNLVGRDIRHLNTLIDETDVRFPDSPGTLAALDIALHDAFGQYIDIPVVELYGQKILSLPTSVTIGIMGVADTLAEAGIYRDLGFRILKVKTGLNVEEDTERILKLREVYGNHFGIRVDANQGYSRDDLQRFCLATATASVELIEQPLPAGQDAELLSLPAELRRMLAADESLTGPTAALQLAMDPQPFGIYNIKLMKCGGVRQAMKMATIAETADIELFWGCNDESRVSIAAALHAAFACGHTRYIDLDGSLDLAEDVVSGGFIIENGYMRPTGGSGLGLR